jgi:hypothetical protein
LWWLGCLALCLGGRLADGQSAPALHYTLTGLVTSLGGAAVVDAEIVIVQSDARELTVRSDSLGHFTAADLTQPVLTVHVRRLGFQPKTLEVNIRGDDRRSSVVIPLDVMPAELDKVSVIANESDPRLREFNTRKATNSFGRYFDGVAIEKRKPQHLSEMLRSIPGVSLLASDNGGNTVRIRGCIPLLWVDAVRMPGAQLDDVARWSDVAAIEVYSSFSGIPAQYFDRSASCGTILVWMKTR